MNPTTVYRLGHARLAEKHRQAQCDELVSAAAAEAISATMRARAHSPSKAPHPT
jgi:hypothetical protein